MQSPPQETKDESTGGLNHASKRHRVKKDALEDGACAKVDGLIMEKVSEYGVLHSKRYDTACALAEGIIEVSDITKSAPSSSMSDLHPTTAFTTS